MKGYSDADWAADSEDRRSTSGNVFLMSNGAISWASQTQPTVALSTAEAAYIALCLATQESVWLRQLCKDLHKALTKFCLVKVRLSLLFEITAIFAVISVKITKFQASFSLWCTIKNVFILLLF